jgi:hypothetical protein
MDSAFEKTYLCKQYFHPVWDKQTRPRHYRILGYDKDADVYVRLINVHMPLDIAISVADHVASLGPKRESNCEPFDWLEVVEELKDIRYHVAPCIKEGEKYA